LLNAGANEFGYRVLKTIVPENIAIAEAIAHQKPITLYAPKSPGAKAYKNLAKEYMEILK
jgi:chromosome partitioning protein